MNTKKYAIYIRVSKENLNVIQTQISFLKNSMSDQKMELDNIYIDISKSSTFNRPSLHKLYKDAEQKKFDTILVKDLTRIARNTEYLRQCLNYLHSISVNLITADNVKEQIITLEKYLKS